MVLRGHHRMMPLTAMNVMTTAIHPTIGNPIQAGSIRNAWLQIRKSRIGPRLTTEVDSLSTSSDTGSIWT